LADTYIDRLLDGSALLDEADDFVDAWHNDPSGQDLHDFLGMTWDEYSFWVEKPNALRLIVAARERERPLADLMEHTRDFALAARGGLTEDEVRNLRAWLQETGRLPPT
jgi:hypothetical protein